jgi:hypothetical protein
MFAKCVGLIFSILLVVGCATDKIEPGHTRRAPASGSDEVVILDPDLTRRFIEFFDKLGSINGVGEMAFDGGSSSEPQIDPDKFEDSRWDAEIECFRNPYRTTVECWAMPAIGYTLSRMPMSAHEIDNNPHSIIKPVKVSFGSQQTDPFIALLKNTYGPDYRFFGTAKGYSVVVSCISRNEKPLNTNRVKMGCAMKSKQPYWSWEELYPLLK